MINARAINVVRQGKTVLSGIDLVLNDGEMLGLVGPNGSGKTTLLRALYGASGLAAGEVALDGVPLPNLSRRAIARRVAVVPQGYASEVDQTVGEVIALGRLPHQGWFTHSRAHDDSAMSTALDRVGLAGHAEVSLSRLSGGERQRTLIARALAQQATHLLLDEPTNHLDLGYQHEILGFIRGLGLSTLVVLHDLNLAARYCDRIALLDEGRLVACGSANDVLTPDRVGSIYRVPTERISTPAGRLHLLFADTPPQ